MRSATSYFKVSAAVIKDDFRRFWAIPVIGSIYYFFSSVFIILMQMKQASVNQYSGDALANFVSTLLSGGNMFDLINVMWISVLSVLLVFRYLHNSGHVIAVHSQPFTRSTLLNSHALSCVLFLAIPIIITGVILLVIAHPVYYSSTYYDSSDQMVDLFARANVLRWMWESFITGLFIMVISIAAGMVTGTSFHHAVAALGFNAVAPLCTLLLTLYFNTYLFGYVQPDWIEHVIEHMSPAINVMNTGFLSAKENALYVVLTVLIYALAMFLYNKRKLERATDGIVFKAVDVLVTLIFGYLGMTGLGLALYGMFDQSKGAATLGYIAGAVLGIVIVRMVIMKTVRVFNKKTAVIMGGYLVIAVVFFVCLNFNVTGYESHIEEDADAITLSLTNNGNDPVFEGGTFDDAESKKAVIELHKFIVDNKSLIKEVEKENNDSLNGDGSMYEDVMYVGFDYMNKSGDPGKKYDTVERRYYSVPDYLVMNSDAFKALADTGALNKHAIDQLPAADKIQYVNISSGAYYSGNSYGTSVSDDIMICSDKAQLASLRAAIESDIRGMTYEDIKRSYNMPIVASFDIVYAVDNERNKDSAADNEAAPQEILSSAAPRDKESSNTVKTSEMSMQITSYYKNTIAWLNSNGYGNMVQYDVSYLNFAVVYDIENGKATDPTDIPDNGYLKEIPQSSQGKKVVTDPAVIKELFENMSSHVAFGALKDMNTSENNTYMVEFYHKEPNADAYYLNMTAYIDGSHVK